MQESKLIENIGSQSGPIGKIKSLKKNHNLHVPIDNISFGKMANESNSWHHIYPQHS